MPSSRTASLGLVDDISDLICIKLCGITVKVVNVIIFTRLTVYSHSSQFIEVKIPVGSSVRIVDALVSYSRHDVHDGHIRTLGL